MAHDRGDAPRNGDLLEEAAASYRRALALAPDLVEAHFNLGSTLTKLGRHAEAEGPYRRVLELRPELAEAQHNLAITLTELGRYLEAEAGFRRALDLDPGHAEGHHNLGVALQRQGRPGEAEASFRQALALAPGFAEAHFSLGSALKDQGRPEEALASFGRWLEGRGGLEAPLRRLTSPLVDLSGLDLGRTEPAPGPVRAAVPPPGPRLRVVLIHPPPWRIPAPGEALEPGAFGPPADPHERSLDADSRIIPYGLMTLAAEARRAGHAARILNLASCTWPEVVARIGERGADVFGISAFCANRRGMAAVAALVRERHPQAHITVGGPFVTALPLDTLRHHPDLDTAVIGEGEHSFLELLTMLASGQPATGIPGTVWRDAGGLVLGPPRARIGDLDGIASPFDHFTSPMVITSRGCPSKCTFCGSFTTWGKKVRFHSIESCLEQFERALARLAVPCLAIKDDTFTADRQRTFALCDGIRARGLTFVWSCDSRVDSLDDALLRRMREAGCQMISLGVESGSPQILATIQKRTTPEKVLEVTRAAKNYGMHVRWYLILGNRGETAETLQQTIDLIREGRPESYLLSGLGFFPGTEEWAQLSREAGLTADLFFRNDFKELGVSTHRHQPLQELLLKVQCRIGALYGFRYSVTERDAVAARLPHLPSVHVERANALCRAGRLDEAEAALDRARELGFPIGGILSNQRACIALARHRPGQALALLEEAFRAHPNHIVATNLLQLRAWSGRPTDRRGPPPVLDDSILALSYLQDWGDQLELA